jgi:hypothetical protein
MITIQSDSDWRLALAERARAGGGEALRVFLRHAVPGAAAGAGGGRSTETAGMGTLLRALSGATIATTAAAPSSRFGGSAPVLEDPVGLLGEAPRRRVSFGETADTRVGAVAGGGGFNGTSGAYSATGGSLALGGDGGEEVDIATRRSRQATRRGIASTPRKGGHVVVGQEALEQAGGIAEWSRGECIGSGSFGKVCVRACIGVHASANVVRARVCVFVRCVCVCVCGVCV